MKIPTDREFADIDWQFAAFISRFGRGKDELVSTIAALVSRSVRQGHVCLDLSKEQVAKDGVSLTDSASMCSCLSKSPAFGPPEASTPIVIAGQRLYLRRYWDYEQGLARSILARARKNGTPAEGDGTQESAIEGALKNRFTIISGGPGTGKTTTVLQILTRFLETPGGDRLRVALTAPTGKAATRLEELLRKIQEDSALDAPLKERMPRSASTIHRLLKWKPDSVFFRHNSRNPLPLDLLIVDEASMVPLPLMAKLFDALPEQARVILLGDRDQLASVEPGSVLADIAEAASTPRSPLRGCLFVLSKNYRFGNANAIYRLSQAVRTGQAEEALQLLAEQKAAELDGNSLPVVAQLPARLERSVTERYHSYLSERGPAGALAQLGRFRVLCALRRGPYGSQQINRLIESVLRRQSLISETSGFYAGMPLVITRNDYQARLFNGDIGIILPDPAETKGQLWAWFIGSDNAPRRVSPARLPEHELAYAMTVHKAQGSEFESVLLLLSDTDNPVLSRELVYTGLTRASKRVEFWYNSDLLRTVIKRMTDRSSGLREALLGNPSGRS